MITYIIRRLLWALVILIMLTLLVFFAMRLLPGDPLLIYVARSQGLASMPPEALARLRTEYGLDKPIMVQYFNWVGNVVRGNFGTSIYFHENVGKLLLKRFPITIYLGTISFVIATIVGTLAGLLAALRRSKLADQIVTPLSYIGITVPIFWLGILMIYLFGLKLRWLPIAGYTSPLDDFWLSTRQIIMPVICLAIADIAALSRQMRSSVLEVIRQDYIRTAWSKGLRESIIVMRHVLKNSLIPVITLMGIAISLIFGGSVLVESVFNIPGIGRLMVQGIFAQDYVVVQSCALVFGVIIVLTNLIVDISYGWLDPRVRYG
ncbi:MAG: ABC transporter permease [Thermodesulfobacteriota bacterium]|jgi:peptide/nickel transport system permease protein